MSLKLLNIQMHRLDMQFQILFETRLIITMLTLKVLDLVMNGLDMLLQGDLFTGTIITVLTVIHLDLLTVFQCLDLTLDLVAFSDVLHQVDLLRGCEVAFVAFEILDVVVDCFDVGL